MTIHTREGIRITDQDLGVPADPRDFSAQNRIMHLLGIDQCFDIVVDSGGVEVRDGDGNEVKLSAAISNVLPPGPTRAFHIIVQTVEHRLNRVQVPDGVEA